MKRTLALLLASILTCSVLLTSLPALEPKVSAATNPVAQGAQGGYLYEWTLRGELEKATINTSADGGAVDFSNSLISIEATGIGGGAYSVMKEGTSAFSGSSSYSFVSAFGDEKAKAFWNNGVTVNEDGSAKVSMDYAKKKIRFVFTAPVEGLYTLVPKQLAGKNVSAYAFSSDKVEWPLDSHAVVYSDAETLSEGDILVRAAKETDAFKQDCETCIELKQGDKLYVEFDASKAESFIRRGKSNEWHDGGCGVVCNFSMVLNSFSSKSEVYSKSYGVGEYVKESTPLTYVDEKGETQKYPLDGKNISWPSGFINGGTFFAEMKNPWDQTVWGRASRYNLNASGGVGFGYGSPAGKYQMTVTPENKVSMNTWTPSFDWRLGFTAPKTDTYYINLSAVTATALTDERVKFFIYTDAALNANGSLKSEDAAFKVYDFYKDRTSVEYPCKDGLLEIKLNEGQKLYFECDVTGGTSYKDLLGVDFTLDIKTGKSIRTNEIYDNFYAYYNVDGNSYEDRYDMGTSETKLDLNIARREKKDSNGNPIYQPTPTIGNDIRWYSTNKAVATVDQSGVVTPVSGANGFTKIVAYNDFASDETVVTVGTVVAPTSVEITGLDNPNIDQYDRVKLGYKITAPSGATAINVNWSSDDNDIVEVNEKGYITAKGVGSTLVTVNVDGVSASTIVIVNPHTCDNTKASWAIIEKATCTEKGLQHLLCDKCFAVLEELVVPANGHTLKEEWITYPTWEKEGSVFAKCFVCDYEGIETRSVGIVKEAIMITAPNKTRDIPTDSVFDPTGMAIEITYENYEHKTTITDFSNVNFIYDFSKEAATNVKFTLAGIELSVSVIVSNGPIVLGDVDDNRTVDTDDTDLLMKYLAGYDVDIRAINADVQLDGDVDVADAVLIYQHLAGQITISN